MVDKYLDSNVYFNNEQFFNNVLEHIYKPLTNCEQT